MGEVHVEARLDSGGARRQDQDAHTHRPTVRRLFLKAASGSECLSRDEEALLFSIYYGAACSLTRKQCEDQLGGDQEKLAGQYQLAAQQALGRANLLTSPSLVTMQAFVLFLIKMSAVRWDWKLGE